MKTTLAVLALFSTAAFAQPGQMPDLEAMFFKQFDADQNGTVSKAEFLKPTEQQFAHMDRDDNGALDSAEIKAFNDEMNQRMQEMQRQMQQHGGTQGMPRR